MSNAEARELQLWEDRSQANGRPRSSRASSAAVRSGGISPLTSMPWELQLMVLSQLDVKGALNLKKTCRIYFNYLTGKVIEKNNTENGYITFDLLNCCSLCLATPAIGDLVFDDSRRQDPWRSLCFKCWRVKCSPDYHRKPQCLIKFVNGRDGHVCTFCGWPSMSDKTHPSCRKKLLAINAVWCTFSGFQFCLLALAVTVAWTSYPNVPQVVLPASLNFFVAFGYFTLFTLDATHQGVTSAHRMPLELLSTILWIPAIVYARKDIDRNEAAWSYYPAFVCAIFAASMLTYVLHAIGFALIFCGYDPRSHSIPGLSKKQKALYVVCSFLVYWAHAKYQ
ncbi:hypothetical protein F4677DRAFT_461664 [Hypoxylon crocopeplum]|nr:hypothetical protein F4677DRAFT_461664 [Hypoxylon crocopeplum]